MQRTNIATTHWYPEKQLIVTHISGECGISDIENWEQSLRKTLDQLSNYTTFKILVNTYGFEAVSIDAHKHFRVVIPLILAEYGWKVGYVDLFEEEAKTITFINSRGIKCVGAAHVHQDAVKMDLFNMDYSSERERFFSDAIQATQWIEQLEMV